MTNDPHRDLTIKYNHLDLPREIDSPDGKVKITYDATGRKFLHELEGKYHRRYAGPLTFVKKEGEDDYALEAAATGDGRLVLDAVESSNRFKYNGKEVLAETGLYDYGARWYDPAIGRWNAVDPLADIYPNHNGYNYTLNNPILLIDPNGLYASGNPYGGNADGSTVTDEHRTSRGELLLNRALASFNSSGADNNTNVTEAATIDIDFYQNVKIRNSRAKVLRTEEKYIGSLSIQVFIDWHKRNKNGFPYPIIDKNIYVINEREKPETDDYGGEVTVRIGDVELDEHVSFQRIVVGVNMVESRDVSWTLTAGGSPIKNTSVGLERTWTKTKTASSTVSLMLQVGSSNGLANVFQVGDNVLKSPSGNIIARIRTKPFISKINGVRW